MQIYDEAAKRRKENERKDEIRKKTELFKIRLRYLAGEITRDEWLSTTNLRERETKRKGDSLVLKASTMQKIFIQKYLEDSGDI